MSKLEKIIIPLSGIGLTNIDLTPAAGFIDSYTVDPDHPSGEKELFLVYDDRVRNDYVTKRAVHLDSSKYLKRKYVKLVDHVPYYVYVFHIKPEIKLSTNGIIQLTAEEKISVLQFWGFPTELVNLLVSSSSIMADYSHQMPLADYYPDEYIDEGLTVTKKGAAS